MLPLWLLITAITMMMTVTATNTIAMTAITPPMMAAVLSDVVVVVHCGSPNVLMVMEQLLSTSRRKPCTAMVESVRETKVPKYVISCELVTWAVPWSLARNVTCCSEFGKHWNALSVIYSVLSPHWQSWFIFWTTALVMSLNLSLVATPCRYCRYKLWW